MTSTRMPPLTPENTYPTIVFVTHGGPLEAKSALLAASLAEHYLPAKMLTRLMEPFDVFDKISEETAQLFDELGVEQRFGKNEISIEYKHGNKITSMRGVTGPTIFLDSDMLLMCPFSWHHTFNADASAKPADLDTFRHGGGSWTEVWKLFGRKVPPKTYVASLSGEKIRPYFNAGFIYARDGDALSEAWLDASRRIDAAPKVINKRPWLDQIALPVAFSLLDWQPRELDVSFNFPNHLAGMEHGLPYFAHYHWPRIVAANPSLMHRTRSLITKYPLLKPILGKYDEWDEVLSKLDERE
ncbi:hypothetical protein PXK63_21475 [Phaeobacter gallaeciensis]|nr:hypothetical protein [Phaeobacter gallaeciensis]MDE4172476.1 hypothetical protein [Phaeobacter gallaeciensis]